MMCSTNEFLAESQKVAVDVSLSQKDEVDMSLFSSLSFMSIKKDYLINVCVNFTEYSL